MATNFESHEYVMFVLSTKMGTYENTAINAKQQYSISLQWIV